MLLALRRLEVRGKLDTAHRVRQYLSSVFRFAIATGRAERDVAADLKGAVATPVSKNHASLTDPAEFGELPRAIDVYEGGLITRTALALRMMQAWADYLDSLKSSPGNVVGIRSKQVA